MNKYVLSIGLTILVALATTTSLPSSAFAQPVAGATELLISDAQVESLESNVFNDTRVRLGANVDCGFGSRDSVYVIDNYNDAYNPNQSNASLEMAKLLLAAFLAGRTVDITVVHYMLGSTAYCAVKRVRMR